MISVNMGDQASWTTNGVNLVAVVVAVAVAVAVAVVAVVVVSSS